MLLKYAFIDASGVVVNVISGELNDSQQEQFLNDYQKLFGAVAIIEVSEDVSVWIGGCYDSNNGFVAPIQPEPVAEIIDQQIVEIQE